MKHEITLKPTRTFEAFAGDEKLGTFRLESEWNGLAQLREEKGETLIVNRDEGFGRVMNALLGDTEETVQVVKASPCVGAKILEANASGQSQAERS